MALLVEGTELAAPENTAREDILKEAGYEQTYDVAEVITRLPTACHPSAFQG